MKTMMLSILTLSLLAFLRPSEMVSNVHLEVRDVDGSLVPGVEITQHPDIIHWAEEGFYILKKVESRTHIFDVKKHAPGFINCDNQKKAIQQDSQLVDLNIVSSQGIRRYRDQLKQLQEQGKPKQALRLIENTKGRYGEMYLDLSIFDEVRSFETELKKDLNSPNGNINPGNWNDFDPNNTEDARIRELLRTGNNELNDSQRNLLLELLNKKDYQKLKLEIEKNQELFSKEQLKVLENNLKIKQ